MREPFEEEAGWADAFGRLAEPEPPAYWEMGKHSGFGPGCPYSHADERGSIFICTGFPDTQQVDEINRQAEENRDEVKLYQESEASK